MAALIYVGPAMAQQILSVPSAQSLSKIEFLYEPHPEDGENWLVLRFLAPGISRETGTVSREESRPDMDYICANIGLKVATDMGGNIDLIMVSLVDKNIKRGESNPDVTQYFTLYRIADSKCVWE